MIDVAICRCKKVGRVTSSADFGVAHEEMIRNGWRYGGNRWRCIECHDKWKESVRKRQSIEGGGA